MEGFGVPVFDSVGNAVRKKRSTTSRRPRPDSSTPPSDNVGKVSSDENTGYETSSRRKEFNLNQFATVASVNPSDGETAHKKIRKTDGAYGEIDGLSSNGGSRSGSEQGRSGVSDFKRCSEGVLAPANWKSTSKVKENIQSQSKKPENHMGSCRKNGESQNSGHEVGLDGGMGSENKLRKVKLKVGGVKLTIHAKTPSEGAGSGSSVKARPLDAPRPRPKLILEENSDDDQYAPSEKASELQGVPWKDFSRGGFGLAKEDSLKNKMPNDASYVKQAEKFEPARKSKRVPKRRMLDEAFNDEEDEEIRYLEKLKVSKAAVNCHEYEDDDEEGSKKQRKLSRVSKIRMADDDFKQELEYGSSRSNRDVKRSRLDRATEDTEYVDEQLASDEDPDAKRKSQRDSVDTLVDGKREMSLTTRQRALQSGRDTSTGASLIEFPNGLPPAPPRKQKEKLSEVEQQLKKAEAAQRRRMQVEKAARESEAEAIRKILGQDSSRKKREDKIKKRRDEIAQEKAANAMTLPSNIIRWVMGPSGTVVTFPDELGLPSIFDPKPHSYPPPREKCAGPSCTNTYKYRDSKSKLPLCSLQCYKAVQEQIQPVSSTC